MNIQEKNEWKVHDTDSIDADDADGIQENEDCCSSCCCVE